jgi:hypothetical protein
VKVVRSPPEQVVQARLGLGHPVIQDEPGGQDVEDLHRVGIVPRDASAEEALGTGQVAPVNTEESPLHFRGLRFPAQETLARVQMLLRPAEQFQTAGGCRAPGPQAICQKPLAERQGIWWNTPVG